MPFTTTDLILGIAIPTLVAMAISFLLHRVDRLREWASGLAVAAGFLTAYVSIELGPLKPDRYWQWLPWLVVASLPVQFTVQWLKKPWAQLAVLLSFFTCCAWLLLPTWPDFMPLRNRYLAGWSVLATVVAFAFHHGFTRMSAAPRFGAVITTGVLFASSALILLADSLRFTQMLMATTASVVGIGVANWKRNDTWFASMSCPIALILGSLLLIQKLNTFTPIPWVAWLLPPIAILPVLLLQKQQTRTNVVWLIVAVVISTTAVGLALREVTFE